MIISVGRSFHQPKSFSSPSAFHALSLQAQLVTLSEQYLVSRVGRKALSPLTICLVHHVFPCLHVVSVSSMRNGLSPYSTQQQYSHPLRLHSNGCSSISHSLLWSLLLECTAGSACPSYPLNLYFTHAILACLHFCSCPSSNPPHGVINPWQVKAMSNSSQCFIHTPVAGVESRTQETSINHICRQSQRYRSAPAIPLLGV